MNAINISKTACRNFKVLIICLLLAACDGSISITADDSIAITATANTTAQNLTVGTAMASFSPLTASGGATPYTYSITSGSLPAGLSLNTSTGAVTGTPTTTYSSANVVFSVKDANEVVASTSSSVSFSVVAAVNVIDPPVAISATADTTAQNLTVGTAMTSFSPLTASGGATPYSYSITSGSLPTGLSLNASTGAVTGTPTATYSSANVVFSVKDANEVVASTSSSVSFSVVAAVNVIDPPVAISATADTTAQNLTVGTAMTSFSPLTASGGATPYSYSITSGSLPAGLTLNSSTGAVSGTATSTYSTSNVVFSVKDANEVVANTSSSVSFSVVAAPVAISATADTTAQNLTVGTAMTSFSPLTASGGATPYSYSITSGSLPTGLSLNASTGAVTGTPTATYSSANVVFSVKDANEVVASTSSSVSFSVVAAPVAISATADTTAQNLTVGTAMTSFSPLTASGGATPYSYSITSGSLPAGLTLNSSTGAVSGTATSTYSTSNVVFSVKDANEVVASTSSSVSFSVVAAPVAISATADTTAQNLTVGTAMTSFSPLTASGGATPYTYSITSGSLPAGLNLNASTGAVTGTPTATYSSANVVFSVKDANEVVASTSSSVSFSVVAAITATADTTAQNLTVGTAMTSFSPLTTSGGATPYTYSITSGSLPAGLSLNSSTGAVSGTATSTYSTSNVVFSVKDANEVVASTSSSVSFTVIAALSPAAGSTEAYVDTTLQITFDSPPTIGTSGYVYVYNADTNTLIDKVGLNALANGSWAADSDLTVTTPTITSTALSSMNTQNAIADNNTEVDRLAGKVTTLSQYRWVFYRPITISGNTATIKLHDGKLAAGSNYYVLIDNGVLSGTYNGSNFTGFTSASAWTFMTRADPSSQTDVTVAATGTSADFRTVQGALNWIMNNCGGSSSHSCNSSSVSKTIAIADGTYNELLFLREVDNLTISGASQAGTVVQYDNFEQYNPGTGGSATVVAMTDSNLTRTINVSNGTRPYLGGGRPVLVVEGGDLLKLTNFTLQNSHLKSSSYRNQAETIYFNSSTLAGSRLMATSMNFLSAQDTILLKGWAWFYNSYITGDIDFLWGSPYAALFENSELHTVSDPTNSSSGGIIIQSRAAYGYPGFVVLNSSLTSDSDIPTGSTYLARANGKTVADGFCSTTFSGTGTLSGNSNYYCDSVAYINTTLGSHIADAGWSGTPNQFPDILDGWREWGSTPSPTARTWTASTTIDLSSLDTREEVFAQWNYNTGWTPTP